MLYILLDKKDRDPAERCREEVIALQSGYGCWIIVSPITADTVGEIMDGSRVGGYIIAGWQLLDANKAR